MKKHSFLALATFVIIGMVALMVSCQKEATENDVAAVQPLKTKSPFEIYKEETSKGKTFKAEYVEGIKPIMIDDLTEVAERDNGPQQCPKNDCCCDCYSRLRFNSTTPANLPWQLDVVATCSPDPASLGSGVLVGSYSSSTHPFGTTEPLYTIDEHYYWFLAIVGANLGPQTLDVTVIDRATNVYNISIPDLVWVGVTGIPVRQLHCDNISYTACYHWENEQYVRVCCL